MLAAIILLSLLILAKRAPHRAPTNQKPTWTDHLKGWEKIFALAGFFAALLIVMNPEFLALDLLGDAAFFDMLVLGLSLQLRNIVFGAWHWLCASASTLSLKISRGIQRDFAVVMFTLSELRILLKQRAP